MTEVGTVSDETVLRQKLDNGNQKCNMMLPLRIMRKGQI